MRATLFGTLLLIWSVSVAVAAEPLTLPKPADLRDLDAYRNAAFFDAELPTASGGVPFQHWSAPHRRELDYLEYTLQVTAWTGFDEEEEECEGWATPIHREIWGYFEVEIAVSSYSTTFYLPDDCEFGHGIYDLVYSVRDSEGSSVSHELILQMGEPEEDDPVVPPPPPPPPNDPYTLYLFPTLVVSESLTHRVQVIHTGKGEPEYAWSFIPLPGKPSGTPEELSEGSLKEFVTVFGANDLLSLEGQSGHMVGVLCVMQERSSLIVSHVLVQPDGALHLREYDPILSRYIPETDEKDCEDVVAEFLPLF